MLTLPSGLGMPMEMISLLGRFGSDWTMSCSISPVSVRHSASRPESSQFISLNTDWKRGARLVSAAAIAYLKSPPINLN